MMRSLASIVVLAVAAPALAQGPAPLKRADAEGRVRLMFETVDTNHDGAVTEQELAAFRDEMRRRREIRTNAGAAPRDAATPPDETAPSAMFAQADANHDGKLSLEELTAASLARFDAADADHDGTVTAAERQPRPAH